MEYTKATLNDKEQIFDLVQRTIKSIYPKYYPQEVVDFFCELHSKTNITKDIENGSVDILKNENQIIGTGSYEDNHITRVYVAPEYQKQGYGSYIMQCLENNISLNYDTVYLDASLPASQMYEKRGYKTIKYQQWPVANGVILVYGIMEKSLPAANISICYEGKYFIPKMNSENGELDKQTIFSYHQKGSMLWADYSGGEEAVLIKPAEKEDALILAELAVQMWNSHTVSELESSFAEVVDSEKGKCFIKYVGDKPVGFAQCQLRYDYVEGTETSPVGYLEGIFIETEFRHKGFAKELLMACENWAKESGCSEFASDCELDNTMSFQFHMAMGFEEANRVICFKKEIQMGELNAE